MRFLLRALVMIALASYLWSHYGDFIRQKVSTGYSVANRELPNRFPAVTEPPVNAQSRPSVPEPVFLPRRDVTPGAIDQRVTQSSIRSTICRRGYSASVRPPFLNTPMQ